MKTGKGARLVRSTTSMVSCFARAKWMAIKTKADAMKTRLMLTAFTVLSKKKLFTMEAIPREINRAIDGLFNHHHSGSNDDDNANAVVLYGTEATGKIGSGDGKYDDHDDDKYPDLTHSLFDEKGEEELVELLADTNSSIIDQVKNSKKDGESFNLEDEIDEVADLFISKFHKRMRLQKLLSFKRYQQMQERSA